MSFVQKFIGSTVQGTIYSSLVGISYKTFIDTEWDLNNLPKLILFWAVAVVPGGIAWSKVNQVVFKMFGTKREIVWNLATFNKKALFCDFILNHVVYQSLFVAAFFEYSKWAFPKTQDSRDSNTLESHEIQAQEAQEAKLQKSQSYGSNDKLYSPENLLHLAKVRLKVALASYFIDMWGPWVGVSYLKNNRIRFAKDLLLGIYWNTTVLERYYFPKPEEPLKNIAVKESAKETPVKSN